MIKPVRPSHKPYKSQHISRTKGRPNVWSYFEIRKFLEDWITYEKSRYPHFSKREFSRRIQFSPGYLPLILAGKRRLTERFFKKALSAMHLSESEQSYLELLQKMGESRSYQEREAALEQLQKMSRYRTENPKEFEAYRFLTRWYYPVIREMSVRLKDFKDDPRWIQKHLKDHVPIYDLYAALRFLKDHGFIDDKAYGRDRSDQDLSLNCDGGIYQMGTAKYHYQMLRLAADSIRTSKREERNILGYTVSLDEKDFPKLKRIMGDALQRVYNLSTGNRNASRVYQLQFAAFPLSNA